MTYLEKSLAEGEKVLAEVGLDWSIVACMVFSGIAAVFIFLVNLDKGAVGWMLVSGVFALWFLNLLIRIKTTEMFLTDKRIVFKAGWISRKTVEIKTEAIESVELEQGVFGRMFACSAKLHVSGRGNQTATIQGLGVGRRTDLQESSRKRLATMRRPSGYSPIPSLPRRPARLFLGETE